MSTMPQTPQEHLTDEREAFEAWASTCSLLGPIGAATRDMRMSRHEAAREAWQARAALATHPAPSAAPAAEPCPQCEVMQRFFRSMGGVQQQIERLRSGDSSDLDPELVAMAKQVVDARPEAFARASAPAQPVAPTTPSSRWKVESEPDPHAGQYDGERAALTLGKLTDDELANGAFMNYDAPLDVHAVIVQRPGYHPPIVWMTAVKDRIRWLSRALEKALATHPPAVQPVAPAGWQPIETAPKEEEVLVWFGPAVGVKSAVYTDLHGDDVWFWCVTDGKFDPHPVRRYCAPYPTHWMPLPATPSAEAQPTPKEN